MFIVYDPETTLIKGKKEGYKTLSAARSAITKLKKEGCTLELTIAQKDDFRSRIEKKVEKINLMSGKPYMERVNTPLCCSPASETYWSL